MQRSQFRIKSTPLFLTKRTAGLQIRALHEASAKVEAIDKQCVVVCVNKVVKGKDGEEERQVTLGALNGVVGTLTSGWI